MFRNNFMNQSRPKKTWSTKKLVGVGLIATALAFNVFLNDPSGPFNLRSSKRNLAVALDDKFKNRIVRKTQQMEDGSEQVIIHFLPSYDILQTDAGVKLSVDVPDFDKEQLNAELVKGEILHLSGETFNDENKEKEIFEISFQLDSKAINMKKIAVTFENNMLTATAPLKTELDEQEDVIPLDIVDGPPSLDLIEKFLESTGVVRTEEEEEAIDGDRPVESKSKSSDEDEKVEEEEKKEEEEDTNTDEKVEEEKEKNTEEKNEVDEERA